MDVKILRDKQEVGVAAAKHAAESKRGQQSQSIEPSRATSAAEWQSPISA